MMRGIGRKKMTRNTGLGVKRLALLLSKYTNLVKSALDICMNIYIYK